jgi:uncharacterized coiled-coil protein SlyX
LEFGAFRQEIPRINQVEATVHKHEQAIQNLRKAMASISREMEKLRKAQEAS